MQQGEQHGPEVYSSRSVHYPKLFKPNTGEQSEHTIEYKTPLSQDKKWIPEKKNDQTF